MAVKQETNKILNKPPETIFQTLMNNFKKEGWKVIYTDEFIAGGKQVKIILGLTSAFGGVVSGGAGILDTIKSSLSLSQHGARYVPYFIKIKELDSNKSEILIISAGSEDIFGFDFGRNKNIVEKIFKFCG
jgi:hypothetical protein